MNTHYIILGALAINVPWILLLLWQHLKHTHEMLEEKQRSFQAGIKYQKNLMSPKVDTETIVR